MGQMVTIAGLVTAGVYAFGGDYYFVQDDDTLPGGGCRGAATNVDGSFKIEGIPSAAYEPGDPYPMTWENSLGQVIVDP